MCFTCHAASTPPRHCLAQLYSYTALYTIQLYSAIQYTIQYIIPLVGSLWLAWLSTYVARVLEMPVLPDGSPKQLRTRTSLQEARDHHVLAIVLQYDPLPCGEWWDTILADS